MSKRGMKWLVVFLVTVLVAVLSIHIYQYMKDRSSAANALGELFVIVDAINKGMVEYKDAYEGTQEAHKKRRIAKEGVDLGSKYSFARESFRKALSELDLMDAPNDKDLEAARKKLRLCATEMERSTDILANALMAYGTRDWKAAKGLNPQEAYAKKDNSVQYLVDALKSMGRVIVDSKLDDNVKRDYVKRYSYMFNVQPTEAIEYIYDLFDVNNAMSEKEDVVDHILTEPVQYDRVKIRSSYAHPIRQAVYRELILLFPKLTEERLAVYYPKKYSQEHKEQSIKIMRTYAGHIKDLEPFTDEAIGKSKFKESEYKIRLHVNRDTDVCIEQELIKKGLAMAVDDIEYEGKNELLKAQSAAKKNALGIWGGGARN